VRILGCVRVGKFVGFLGYAILSLPRKMLIGIVVVFVLAVINTVVTINGFDVLYVTRIN
jgi:hypothetical protein